MKNLYLYVTKDHLELPLAVSGSVAELARIVGVQPGAIRSAMSRAKRLGYTSRYVKVEIE